MDTETALTPNAPVENPPESGAGRDPLQETITDVYSYDTFRQMNPKRGQLRVQVYTGQRTFPVSGASVLITRNFTDGERRFAAGVTDESGIFGDISLPAPSGILAQTPTGEAPYASYDIRVSRPGFRTEIFRQAPVFPNVTSIQPVQLLPDGVR